MGVDRLDVRTKGAAEDTFEQALQA
jgi:hypothetical protein